MHVMKEVYMMHTHEGPDHVCRGRKVSPRKKDQRMSRVYSSKERTIGGNWVKRRENGLDRQNRM